MTEEKIYQAIISQINTLEDYSLDFIFSSTNSPYLNIESITLSFQREWEGVREFLKEKDFEEKVVSMLFPKKPYDLSIIEKIRNFFPASSPNNCCIFLDMCIAKILYDLAWKYRRRVSHQLLLELLNIYKLRNIPLFFY